MIEPGTILNERYKLIKTLGEGGMANVYLAQYLDEPAHWSPWLLVESGELYRGHFANQAGEP